MSVAGDMGATPVNSVNRFSHPQRPILITVDKICLIVPLWHVKVTASLRFIFAPTWSRSIKEFAASYNYYVPDS